MLPATMVLVSVWVTLSPIFADPSDTTLRGLIAVSVSDKGSHEQTLLAEARSADEHGDYTSGIRLRSGAWHEHDQTDGFFHSELKVADAVGYIALGKYAEAKLALQVATQPYPIKLNIDMPVLANGLTRPSLADYRSEFNRLGGNMKQTHPNPCFDDLAFAVGAAARGSFVEAKRLLLRGFTRQGCFPQERSRYLPYLAAISLSEGERDQAILWLYRALVTPIPSGDLDGISFSAEVASVVFASTDSRDLEIIRAYMLAGV